MNFDSISVDCMRQERKKNSFRAKKEWKINSDERELFENGFQSTSIWSNRIHNESEWIAQKQRTKKSSKNSVSSTNVICFYDTKWKVLYAAKNATNSLDGSTSNNPNTFEWPIHTSKRFISFTFAFTSFIAFLLFQLNFFVCVFILFDHNTVLVLIEQKKHNFESTGMCVGWNREWRWWFGSCENIISSRQSNQQRELNEKGWKNYRFPFFPLMWQSNWHEKRWDAAVKASPTAVTQMQQWRGIRFLPSSDDRDDDDNNDVDFYRQQHTHHTLRKLLSTLV